MSSIRIHNFARSKEDTSGHEIEAEMNNFLKGEDVQFIKLEKYFEDILTLRYRKRRNEDTSVR